MKRTCSGCNKISVSSCGWQYCTIHRIYVDNVKYEDTEDLIEMKKLYKECQITYELEDDVCEYKIDDPRYWDCGTIDILGCNYNGN